MIISVMNVCLCMCAWGVAYRLSKIQKALEESNKIERSRLEILSKQASRSAGSTQSEGRYSAFE
jgi:hypothetical protein